ncbi:MAG: energy-dependent translational throttle protein EttA [Planctomycetes bacterium]|nr:energy-dependent translational throttle protein EttA [Planctomycetota bacterium]
MANPQYIYSVERLRKVWDQKEVLKGITLSFLPGAKIGIIGSNGAGKSTLLRIMAGLDTEFEGEALPAPGIRIGHVLQEPRLDLDKNVRENIEEGLGETKSLLLRFEAINAKIGDVSDPDEMQKLLDEMSSVQEKIDAADGWSLDTHVQIAMEALRTPPGDANVATLSGGEKRRVALAKVLLSRPDLLLLDEPTNHLDADSVAWLEEHLREYPGTVLLVTHDRYFLDNVVGWMLEIDRGRAFPYPGNYSSYLEQKSKRLEIEQREGVRREKHIGRELEWVRTSPSARTVKNRARLRRYEELLAEEYEHAEDDIDLEIPPGPRLGDRVFQLEHVAKSYDGRRIISDVTFEVPRCAIVGIIGPNGAGKTTVFKLLTGAEKPDTGTIVVGDTVKMTYVDQQREDLSDEKTVFDEISGGNEWLQFGSMRIHARGYISRFNFRGEDQQKRVGELSGGQRNRVQLAKLLRQGANVILLDEPTNDLDLGTLRVLEDALSAFAGTVMVVSHDRWFLDRIATHILAFEGDGKVRWFEGGYTAYAERRAEELGAAGLDRRGPKRKLYGR